jgi:hypothetical protein
MKTFEIDQEGRTHKWYKDSIYPNGTCKWFVDGKLHREDGPAVEYVDGRSYWYKNGIIDWEIKL